MQVRSALLIHGKNCRPIRAQNLGSHGSKDPHAAPNQHTRNLDTWERRKETCGRPPEQRGAGGAHLPVGRPPWSGPHRPPASAGSFLPPSLSQFPVPELVKLGARPPTSSLYKYERGAGVRMRRAQVEALLHFSLE